MIIFYHFLLVLILLLIYLISSKNSNYIGTLGYSAFESNEGGWDVQNYGWIISICPIYMLRGTPNSSKRWSFSYKKINMWETLFWGDQLTVAHARGSIAIRRNHPDDKKDSKDLFQLWRTGILGWRLWKWVKCNITVKDMSYL